MQLTLKESRSLWDWRAPRWRENPAADLWLDSWTSGHEPLCPLEGEAQALLARTEAWIINCSYWRSKRIRQQRNSKRGGDWYRAFSGLTSRTNLLGKKLLDYVEPAYSSTLGEEPLFCININQSFCVFSKLLVWLTAFNLTQDFHYIYIFFERHQNPSSSQQGRGGSRRDLTTLTVWEMLWGCDLRLGGEARAPCISMPAGATQNVFWNRSLFRKPNSFIREGKAGRGSKQAGWLAG